MNYSLSPSTTPVILVVEDDEATAEMISLLLEDVHYQPIVVGSGTETMQMLYTLSHLPSLLILDYRLPDTTGIQLYDYCQSQPEFKDIPALLMSASKPAEEIAPRDLATICKPFDLDDFLSAIHHLLKTEPVIA